MQSSEIWVQLSLMINPPDPRERKYLSSKLADGRRHKNVSKKGTSCCQLLVTPFPHGRHHRRPSQAPADLTPGPFHCYDYSCQRAGWREERRHSLGQACSMASRKVVGRRLEVLRKMKFGNCQWKLITPALRAASVGSGLTFEQSWTESLIVEGQENCLAQLPISQGTKQSKVPWRVRPWIMVNYKETIIIYLWTYLTGYMSVSHTPPPTFLPFDPRRKTSTNSSFPAKSDSVPQPRTLLCDGLGLRPAPLALSPSLPLPSAALLIYSILAAASCVTETERNFLFDFNSEEIPVTQFLLLIRKKNPELCSREFSFFPGTNVHGKYISPSLLLFWAGEGPGKQEIYRQPGPCPEISTASPSTSQGLYLIC